MSEETTIVVERRRDGTMWQHMPDGSVVRVESKSKGHRVPLSEEEIIANALSDPDNPPMTEEQLNRMRRIPHPAKIRAKLGISREEFATRFGIPLNMLRDWEERPGWLNTAEMSYLYVIEQDPEGVAKALANSYPKPELVGNVSGQ